MTALNNIIKLQMRISSRAQSVNELNCAGLMFGFLYFSRQINETDWNLNCDKSVHTVQVCNFKVT